MTGTEGTADRPSCPWCSGTSTDWDGTAYPPLNGTTMWCRDCGRGWYRGSEPSTKQTRRMPPRT